jgi:probable addiction module antidote protein
VAASEDGDPRALVTALGDVIRARNVSKIARDAGLTREGIYKAFSADGNPSLSTVVRVARALDLGVTFRVEKSKAKVMAAGRGRKVLEKSAPRRSGAKSGARIAKS